MGWLLPPAFILQTFDTRNARPAVYTNIVCVCMYVYTNTRPPRTQFTVTVYKCLGVVNLSDIKWT